MSLGAILLVIAILIVLGVIPTWPYSRGWGYYPSSFVGVVLIVLVALFAAVRL
jgi:hypothetical protein